MTFVLRLLCFDIVIKPIIASIGRLIAFADLLDAAKTVYGFKAALGIAKLNSLSKGWVALQSYCKH